MVKFILKRIGTMIIAMFMIILITFTLMHALGVGERATGNGVTWLNVSRPASDTGSRP